VGKTKYRPKQLQPAAGPRRADIFERVGVHEATLMLRGWRSMFVLFPAQLRAA